METTRPVLSLRAALQALLAKVDYTKDARTAIELETIADAHAALAAPFGLPETQEPKYTTDARGRLINRSTRVEIPADEPIMIFRAKDVHACVTVRRYVDLIAESAGRSHVHERVCFERYQSFIDFAAGHPDRMCEPN